MRNTAVAYLKYLPLLFLSLTPDAFTKVSERYNKAFAKGKFKTTKQVDLVLSERKEPIVILNFWASWCQPCIKEFRGLNALIENLGKDKIFVLGINNDVVDPEKKIAKTEKKYDLKFSSVLEEKSGLADQFMVSRIPTSIIFVNKKFYKFIPEEFDFSDKDFIKKLRLEAKLQPEDFGPKSK